MKIQNKRHLINYIISMIGCIMVYSLMLFVYNYDHNTSTIIGMVSFFGFINYLK